MTKDINPNFFSDLSALEEAASSERFYRLLGPINDEKAFLSICSSIDAIIGMHNTPTRTDAIVHDKVRSIYFDTILILIRETKLTLKELDRVLKDVVETTKGSAPIPFERLVPYLVKWCHYPHFEPEWHMKKRGAGTPLPTSKNKDLWGYLLGLYTNPEKVRLREPDYVKRHKAMYPGYEECLSRARRAATQEMKRLYGDDVDLSPVTDLPKQASADETNFIDMLRSGGDGNLFTQQT